jgi:hypothetical protein
VFKSVAVFYCVHSAVTYYLNSTWNPNRGGDLVVMTRMPMLPPSEIDQGTWTSPRKNRLVIATAGVPGRIRDERISPSSEAVTIHDFATIEAILAPPWASL